MQTILLQVLHWLWSRRNNIWSIYKGILNDDKIKIDGKLSFEEFKEYIKIFSNSGLTEKSFLNDDEILSGSIVGDKLQENTSKRLILNQQTGVTCVPHSLIRMINYNTSVVIDEEKKLAYIEDMKKLGLIKTEGASIKDISAYLKERIQKDYGIELVYFKEDFGSEKYNELMSKNYAHSIGGAMTDTYIADFTLDGDIDIENYKFNETKKYYHFFMNLPKSEADKRGGNLVENYNIRFGVKNIYKNDFIGTFMKKEYFYKYGYFFVERSNIDEEILSQEKAELKKDIIGNRFYKFILPEIQKGYKPLFTDYEDKSNITVGEAKVLIDIANLRK